MMWPLPDNSCRYVRIRCPDEEIRFRFGFGEIELFADGRNLALNKLVFPRGGEEQVLGNLGRSPTALTDGRNLYGNILPIRSWMNQLARRHDLETERPKIIEELNRRYARQKTNLRRMSWLAVGLAAAVGVIILFDRMLRIRQVTQLREQFAADLHDELGANIHSIGLLGDLAREAIVSICLRLKIFVKTWEKTLNDVLLVC